MSTPHFMHCSIGHRMTSLAEYTLFFRFYNGWTELHLAGSHQIQYCSLLNTSQILTYYCYTDAPVIDKHKENHFNVYWTLFLLTFLLFCFLFFQINPGIKFSGLVVRLINTQLNPWLGMRLGTEDTLYTPFVHKPCSVSCVYKTSKHIV